MFGALVGTWAGFDVFMASANNPEGDDNVILDDDLSDTTDMVFRASVFFLTWDFEFGFGMFLSLIGNLGAVWFLPFLVLSTAIWLCIDAILYCVLWNWFSAVVVAAYSYPHFALFRALQSSTLTRENYHVTEKYCCCCPNKIDSRRSFHFVFAEV
jgi:hypothetical protein